MPIVIKELFASDPLSEALEKINFNFDQMILAGGGPPGPMGSQGPAGVPGPQGDRGDHWQVGGAIGPTSDHGPGFGSLLQNDLWTSATGQVYAWNKLLSTWSDTVVNLMGPAGATGVTGGSYEWRLYYGATSNYRIASYTGGGLSSNNWLPFGNSQIVDNPNVNFLTPVGGGKNSLLLGDVEWAKFNLNNFVGWNNAPGTLPNQTPKLTIIQNSVDFVGFGGLAIGAYGMTSATGTISSNFVGGLANNPAGTTGPTGDARNMFFAGMAIKSETISGLSVLGHVFRARTNTIDLELQAGDINPSMSDGKSPSIRISNSNSTIFRGLVPATDAGSSDLVRSVIGPTYSRYRDLLAVGFNTTQLPSLQNIIVADGGTNQLIVNGDSRIHGTLRVGNRSTATNQIYIGTERLVNGNSEINMYAGVANTGLFQIKRFGGTNGPSQIVNTGTGSMFIENSASNVQFITSASNGYISFRNNTPVETARFDTVNNRLGVGTITPVSPLHINGPLGSSQATIATFSNQLNSSYTTIGVAGVSSSVPTWISGSNIIESVPHNVTGNLIISAYTGSLNFQTDDRKNRMTISPDGNVGIGTITPVGSTNNTLQINSSLISVGSSANIAFTHNSGGSGYYLRRNIYPGTQMNFELLYSNTYAAAANELPIISVKTNGAVGIGTTAPNSSLHVKGVIKSDIPLSGGVLVLNNPDTILLNSQVIGSQIFTGNATFSGNITPFNAANITVKSANPTFSGPHSPVNLDMQTVNSAGALSSRIFINGYNGTVGINTVAPNPAVKLHVQGGVTFTGSGESSGVPAVLSTSGDGTAFWSPLSNSGVPTGTIVMYYPNVAPPGWMICRGGLLSLTNPAHTALIQMLGGTVLPDCRGLMPIGTNPANGRWANSGQVGGSETITLTARQSGIQNHSHPVPGFAVGGGGHEHNIGYNNSNKWTGGNGGSAREVGSGSNQSTGGGGGHTHTIPSHDTSAVSANALDSHDNMPPYFAVNYIIKL